MSAGPGVQLVLFELLKFGSIGSLMWVSGYSVHRFGIRVNYTRKLNHFFLFFWQFVLRAKFEATGLTASRVVDGGLTLFCLTAIFVRPLRQRVPLLNTMFAAYDRPEDRPHTLQLICIQLLLTFVALLPLAWYFRRTDFNEAITILLLVNGIGDGLAEPVGVRFGRHWYRVPSLFKERIHRRSWEGSACVFVTAVVLLLLYHGQFSTPELLGSLLLFPLGVTLAEAWSPHTVDSPLIFLVGGCVLAGVTATL
ncbi:MAG: hypothetical protein VX836_17070 [Pseudomonadota bacterium]|nr:hypothetical protein [Pseudomonadota bacterium]